MTCQVNSTNTYMSIIRIKQFPLWEAVKWEAEVVLASSWKKGIPGLPPLPTSASHGGCQGCGRRRWSCYVVGIKGFQDHLRLSPPPPFSPPTTATHHHRLPSQHHLSRWKAVRWDAEVVLVRNWKTIRDFPYLEGIGLKAYLALYEKKL